MPRHPLQRILRRAAAGTLPEADGAVDVMPSPPGPVDAVIGFTAHLVVAADVQEEEVRDQLANDDFTGWMAPPFLLWLADRLGSRPGSHDLVLAAVGPAPECDLSLVTAERASDHPRVRRASRYRTDVRVFTDPDEFGVLVLGRGLARRGLQRMAKHQ